VKTSQATLLRRVRQWDEEALTAAYDEFAPAVYRYAYRLTGHRETAEEVVSETFHRFLVSLKNGGGPEQNLSAWLYRVAHNLVVDRWRRKPAQEEVPLTETSRVSTGDRILERVAQQQEVENVRRALKFLTPLQRQVIVLRYLEGMSTREIAAVIERDVNAVKALQHRAVNSLKRLLKENNEKVD
jgi:RNA polymerase sigma-70 factor, ECF subfamily